MYTLLAGLWKYMFQKDEFFILILGLDNAGKTVGSNILFTHSAVLWQWYISFHLNKWWIRNVTPGAGVWPSG
jgi:hypothetical protein